MVQITSMFHADAARTMPSNDSYLLRKKTNWKPSLKKLKHGLTPGKADANRLTAQESELLHNLSNWQWEKAVETRESSKKRQSQTRVSKPPIHLQMTPVHRLGQDQTPTSDYLKRKSLPKRPRRPSSMSSLSPTPYVSELAASEPRKNSRKTTLPKLTFEDEEDLQEFISSSCFAAAQDIHFWAIDIQNPTPKPKDDIPTKFIAELPAPDSQRTSTSTQSRDSLLIEDIMEFLKPRKESKMSSRITSWFDDEKDDFTSLDASVSDEKEVMSDTSSRLDKSAGSSFEIYRGWESE